MNNHKITLFTSDNLHFKTKPWSSACSFLLPFLSSGSLPGEGKEIPSSRAPRASHALLAPLTRPKSPFSSLSNASHAGYQAPAKFISTYARKIRAVTKAVPVWAFVHT